MAFPTGWSYRCPIIIAAGTVGDALADWPLLLTEANLPAEIFTDANADGSDIRASSDEAGTAELAVEVVSFDAGGTAEIWVKVPSVSAVADTTIYLWFGNGSATLPAADSAFGSQAVWAEGAAQTFGCVYHFGTPSVLSLLDSTANANDFTNSGVTAAASQIGGGASFGGGDRSLVNTSPAGLPLGATDDFTISLWAYPASLTAGLVFNLAGIGDEVADNGSHRSIIRYNNHVYFWGYNRDKDCGVDYNAAQQKLDIVGEYNGSTTSVTVYRNNASIGTASLALMNARNRVYVGEQQFAWQGYYTGTVDEFRISSVARSPAWIAADYASQSSPGTFAAAGTVAVVGKPEPLVIADAYHVHAAGSPGVVQRYHPGHAVLYVPAESRTLIVPPANRTLRVAAESRTLTVSR